MSNEQEIQDNESQTGSRKRRGFPPVSLESVVVVAQSIADNNAGKPFNRLSLAESINRKPESSGFRDMLSASIAYGLTEGTWNVTHIKLTPLGQAITMPRNDSERQQALVKAARNIQLCDQLYVKFDQAKIPPDPNFKNVLIREHGVDAQYADAFIVLFKSDGKFTGLIRNTGGADRVDLQQDFLIHGGSRVHDDSEDIVGDGDGHGAISNDELAANSVKPPFAAAPPQQLNEPPKNAIFIGHGKDHNAVEQLKQLLEQMGVKGVIAKDEPHAGRPISQKVAECMRECSAGIFVASGDDDGVDAKGNAVKRARENVIYELGAASFAYGQRIVIFKEKGVEFPSDFSDLGYIEYEKGHLADKFAELIGELVKLKAVRIQAGG